MLLKTAKPTINYKPTPFIMKIFSYFKQWSGILAGLVLMAMPLTASAAQVVAGDGNVIVQGKVVDEGGNPVPGAILVVESNSFYNAMTDENGAYSIEVPKGSKVSVSCIGFVAFSFTANSVTQNVTLMSDMQSLDESVVVGYGTQKKANLTGAIAVISEKAISATTTNDLVTKLQGKVAGLNIRNNSGTPGSYDNNINVRGFGAPLYVIDGINRTAADFNRLNSEDIESISVLKDASAAIYGLNAANGVIIVTTKKGNDVGRARFQFNANVGFSSPTDQVEMADAYTYFYLRNAANINSGMEPFITPEELEKWKSGEYTGTNWYDEVFKKNAIRQEYSVSADGGSERVQYYFNVNYTADNGLLKSGDLYYNKWNFRSNVTAKLTDGLKAAVKVSGYIDESESPTSNFFNIWRGTVNSLPYKPVYADPEETMYNSVKDGQSYNPVALSYSENTGYNRTRHTSVNTTFNLEWNPTFCRDFTLSGTVAYDKRLTHGKTLKKNWTMYTYDEANETYVGEDWNPIAKITSSYNNISYITTQVQAKYNKLFADAHNFGAQFIFETRASDNDYDSIEKFYDFYSNDQLDYASNNDAKAAGNEIKTRNMSFVGRLNYDYRGRYLIELAARYDGSYRYSPKVRWGFFPVVSLGWRISEENWMKGASDWLSNLKIRASLGQIGYDTGDPFQYIAGFSTSGGGWYEFSEGKTTTGVATPALVNETMTWTKNTIADIGVDLSFLDNRISVTADIFRRDKTGILAYRSVSLPNTFGATFPQENLNSNRTHGFDLAVGYQDRVDDYFFSISGNVTWARTMNRYLEGANYLNSWSNYRNNMTNRYSDIAWVYHVIGQFESQEEIDNYALYSVSRGQQYVQPGDWKYEDVNGDGVIDGDDMRPISLSNGASPHWNFGLTLSGSWRGLDYNILLQGAAGFKTYHDLTYTTPFWQESNIPTYYLDSWHHEDPYDASSPWVKGSLPSVRTNTFAPYLNQYQSTASYMDCSYVRLKNVEIGYTFNQQALRKAKIEKIRLFVSGNNLLTLCNKYAKAYDPEVTAGSANTGWVYPLSRTWNVGINLNF